MSIFYAYCRIVDDIADSTTLSVEEKKTQLGEWREEIRRAYLDRPQTELGNELAEIIRTYLIPPTPLEEIINGVEMDLSIDRYQDFAGLAQYCYRVASAVGLVSIEIFGYQHKQTQEYAVALGMAFQLTNILRDVQKDASFGRIYLPQDELKWWSVSEKEIFESQWSPKIQNLFRFQYHRASHYFAKSLRLLHPTDRPNMIAAEVMREVYQGVLEKIRRHDFNVFDPKAQLKKLEKVSAVWRARQRETGSPVTLPNPKKVLVLGGGFAGLAAACELSRLGHQVTVWEGKSLLGGRAHSFQEHKSGETIDNGQHILMGCYPETLSFLKDLGVESRLQFQNQLKVQYASNSGISTMEAASLPAPFHLLSALLKFSEISWTDRWAAVRLSLRLQVGQKPKKDESVSSWLSRWNQTPGIIRAVWEPLCLAALNEPIASADAGLFCTVLKRSLLGSAEASRIILSKVGLSDLFVPEAQKLIEMSEGTVATGHTIQSIEFEGDRVKRVRAQNGAVFEPDHVVSSLPWTALRPLLPAESSLAEQCRQIPDAPIISIHLWFDRPLFSEPFLGFLDSPIQWVFNDRAIHESTSQQYRYAAVISGAYDLLEKPSAALEELVLSELHRLVPASREAVLSHRFVYKCRNATFAARPEIEKLRPISRTQWKNFWLAGDWTQTGLPATIESAVWSGYRAAQEVDQAES